MQKIETSIKGVYIIKPQVFSDSRGWFTESWSGRKLEALDIFCEFVQDNHSMSAKAGTLRGLHFQNDPRAQLKLVRCTRGAIMDVAVDLRKGSPTYLRWVSEELSAENHSMLLIPRGFAHGYLTLTDNAEVQYKTDSYYDPALDRSIRHDDPEIGLAWGIDSPILSEKDEAAPLLADSDCNFVYKEEL